MRLGCGSGSVRGYAAAALAIVLSCLSPAPIGLAQSPPPVTPWRGLIDHVSASSSGALPQGSADLAAHAISGDGRYVVMHSMAYDLVPDDWNWETDVFLRDRQTGATTRLSVGDGGVEANGLSGWAAISTNGRHVVYMSTATNLVAGDTNGWWDIFVRDLDAARTVRVSVATDGTQGDADSYWPAISATGRFVAFVSQATTFVPGREPYQPRQLYVHDRDTDGNGVFDEPGGIATTLESISTAGEVANAFVDYPRITADGRLVLFESQATNLEPATDGTYHLYVRDRQAGTTTLVDTAVTGGPSAWGVDLRSSDISDDGRFITFTSYSQDIVWLDMNWVSQVFLYDAAAAPASRFSIVTALPDGTLANGASFDTAISQNGQYVVFRSMATNLAAPAPQPQSGGVFVRDIAAGTFTRVDVLDTGEPLNHVYPYTPSISADGMTIAFVSPATNVVGGGSWGELQHVFAVTGFAAEPASASFPMEGGSGSIEVNTSAVSGWNAVSFDPWITITSGGGFGAGPRTIEYFVDSNGAGIVRDGQIRLGSKIFAIHQEGDGDTTPPIITPVVTGTLHASGWYTSDLTIEFAVTDPESEVVSVSPGCAGATFTSDFLYASPTCEATSHGGSRSVSVPLRRDTTAPNIAINSPATTIYAAGSQVLANYNCNDPYAGVASCAITTGSSPINTTTPGRHQFTVSAVDQAGNAGSKTVEYIVGSTACIAQPAGLKAWMPLDGHTRDLVQQRLTAPYTSSGSFSTGVAGQAWSNGAQGNYLALSDEGQLLVGDAETIAMWVKPFGNFGQSGTLVTKPANYRIARYPDGTLRWAFSQTDGYTWVNTGVVLPTSLWSHVAVSYENGLVRSYVNGRLVHSHQLTGSLVEASGVDSSVTVVGRTDLEATLVGVIDDVQIYDRAMGTEEIETLVTSGSGSLCIPYRSTVSIEAPSTIPYGPTFRATLVLRDEAGNPLPNKEVLLGSHVGTGGFGYIVSSRTDASGRLSYDLRIDPNAPFGFYTRAVSATFHGDNLYAGSSAQASATLVAGTPAISWPSPAAITYGATLGAAQLNATANTPGTFVYSPGLGTLLDAGTHTLSVTFTPDDPTRWAEATATATLIVNKATPSFSVVGGTFTYDKQPHAGSATATGVFGESISPLRLVYNDSSETPPTDAGTHAVRAEFDGSPNYAAAQSAAVPLVIGKATPTFEISPDAFYTGYPRQATVTVRGVGEDVLNPYTVFYNGSPTVPVDAGTYAVHVEFAGNANYAAAAADTAFVIKKATPLVGIGSETVTYDGQPHGIAANVSGVRNEWLTPVVTTYNGSTVLPVSAGVYTIEVRYDGSANYNAITATATLTILKRAPYLVWSPSWSSIFYGTPLNAEQLAATSDVPGTFNYSPDTGTVLNVGSHTLTAVFTPADEVNYTTGSVTRNISVSKATPSVSWAQPSAIVYGTPLGASQLNATADVAGTFAYDPPAGTVLTAGTQILWTDFTPEDTLNYNTVRRGVAVTVMPASVAITWPSPASIVHGTPLTAAQLAATASVPGTFAYSPTAGTVLNAGTHTLTATFTPDDPNYAPGTASATVTVTKATPGVTWATPQSIVYGTALGTAQLNAAASVAGSFAYSPSAGTVLGAGVRPLSVVFTPYDSANYEPAAATVSLTVSRATPVLTWPTPQNIVYGTALGFYELKASANVAGTFVYTPPAGTILDPSAGQVLSAAFTPDDGLNYESAVVTTTITVVPATPFVSWLPAALTYGTPLGEAQLNATANVAGTFAYSPVAGTVLNAGSHTLSVTFTPTDSTRYNSTTRTAQLTVNRKASTVSWSAPDAIAYGTPLGSTQLNASADVPGAFTYTPAAWEVLPAGTHTLSVMFVPNDSANYTEDTASVVLTVVPAAANINWADPSPIVYGTPLGGAQLNAAASVPGTFSYSPAAGTVLAAGTYTLSVTFTPTDSANYTGFSTTRSLTVQKAPLTIAANNASKRFGAPLPPISASAAGFVNGDSMASLGGALTFTTAATASSAVGAYPVTPQGVFSPNYTIEFVNGTLTVVKADTTVAVVVSPDPVGFNQPVTFSATVGVIAPGAGAPGGTIQFLDGGTVVGTATLTDGTASITTNGLSAGSHSISVVYSGDGSFAESSGAAALTVNEAVASSSTNVTSSRNPSSIGQSVTFSATVTGPGGTVEGMVEFYDGTVLLGSEAVSNGVARLTTAALPEGGHAIVARYLGNGSLPPSVSSALAQTVQSSGTKSSSIDVTVSPSPAPLGTAVTITATVTGGQNKAPTGAVVFMINGSVVSEVPVVKTGNITSAAVLQTSDLPRGTHSIVAVYLADVNFRASEKLITLTVN
jgi:hypothetical protein